ncbi:putative bromodomain associated domain protein [Phaeomoniella chlamydospora]|uniref:Putative bromodomain associated domain protein n=1 Tax=Phaeomoniella chlamydospora TaxID=158046 RepID=A0A0G2EQS4_PHACM|nr:putative bromodomain associated domain protein [Phaeomoniella chlamydospora]
MSPSDLHTALLRPAVIQILRAAGFNNARPSSATAQAAFSNHNSFVPTVQDVRLALLEAGALFPQMSVLEEEAEGSEDINGEIVPFEDLRGVESFVNWARGPVNKEIRRVAGVAASGKDLTDVNLIDDGEDFLTAMKKKHSKTGEESRYQGTVLGKDGEEPSVVIVGGPVNSLQEWGIKLKSSRTVSHSDLTGAPTPATSGISSAPDSPMMDDNDDENDDDDDVVVDAEDEDDPPL